MNVPACAFASASSSLTLVISGSSTRLFKRKPESEWAGMEVTGVVVHWAFSESRIMLSGSITAFAGSMRWFPRSASDVTARLRVLGRQFGSGRSAWVD